MFPLKISNIKMDNIHILDSIKNVLLNYIESDSSRVFWRPPAPGNNNTFYFEIVLIYVLFSVTNKRIFYCRHNAIYLPE